MARRFAIKDHQREVELYTHRTIASVIIILAMTAILIARFIHLQVIQEKMYKTLSDRNQITLLPVNPNRGLIYDRNGVVLAQNVPMLSLEMIPDKVKDVNKTIKQLQSIIYISDEDIRRFKRSLRQHRRFESIPLRLKLTDEEVALFYVDQQRFPGVLIEAQLVRYYPKGPEFVTALGYVGRINVAELNRIDNTNYAATNYIGKLGIEKHYEDLLHGKVGYKEAEIDASGRIVRVLKNIPPVPGHDIYLTLDSRLQQAAKLALGSDRGAIVAMDPNNGEILAMVSNPSYDPNQFVQGIPNADYQALRADPAQPLYNRAIRGQYALASTIKPYMALAGLFYQATTPSYSFQDPGWFQLKNSAHVFRDWKKGGHGRVNLSTAITVSCDIYFFELALKLGIAHMHDMLTRFGFGHLTGIDVDEELPGLIPNADWKRAHLGASWYPGDTVNAGIGQGYMLATPLQLANGVSGIANRGIHWQAHLLKKHQGADGRVIEPAPLALPPVEGLNADDWDLVITAMNNVTASGRGTAYAKFVGAPYTVAGKTGTAQLIKKGDDDDHGKDSPDHLKDNSLFIAFAPIDKPRIALGIIVENKHGMAPFLARQVLDAFFLGVMPNESPQTPAQPATVEPEPVRE